MNKKCIFHIPCHVDTNSKSGSAIRPFKMIKGFESNGYDVFCIMGYGKERKAQILKLKERIERGENFDFVYSESSTMPTLLTEKNHLPKYPFMDFGFLAYCRKRHIPVGLFYRDIYWKFPIYRQEVSTLKRMISVPMYRYDLKKYEQILTRMYLPSLKMKDYVGINVPYEQLPPGSEPCSIKKQEDDSGSIKLFYVGGIGDLYNLKELFQAVKNCEYVKLAVCCRADEWNMRKDYYQPYMCENVTIVHKSGDELRRFYEEADLAMLFFESKGYRSFAMPIKLFEYLAYQTPVIATKGSAAGAFVEENDIGWAVEFSVQELEKLLEKIHEKPVILEEKKYKMKQVLDRHTWKARAEQVIIGLKAN